MEVVLRFTHRLDLALRLVDTTDGRVISEQSTKILVDGKPVPYGIKGGTIILQNIGREEFLLDVKAMGYEPWQRHIVLAELDQKLPQLELQLLPGADYPLWKPLLALDGHMDGMTELTAVRLGDNDCLIREFDPRKKLMTIFNPHKLALERIHYGLVDPEREIFEPFEIIKAPNDKTLKIDHRLELECKNYFAICPVVFGQVDEEGNYRLRVQETPKNARWVLRCVADGVPRFTTVDFREEAPLEWKEA